MPENKRISKKKSNGEGKWYALKCILLIFSLLISIGTIFSMCTNAVSKSTSLYEKWSRKSIDVSAYGIGGIGADGEVLKEDEGTLYLTEPISTDGLECSLKEGAKIRYQLFFYDKDGAYMLSTEPLAVDFKSSAVPKGAATVRVLILPIADEDGKITEFERSGYADQLKITIKR